MKKLRYLLLVLGLTTGSLFAAYANTASGTAIDSDGKNVTISYSVSSVVRYANSAITPSATVAKNGGISFGTATWIFPGNNTIVAGAGNTYTFSLINSGNYTDTVDAAIVATTGGFAGTWASSLDSSSIVISREGTVAGISLFVTADAAAADGAVGGLTVSLNGTDAAGFYLPYTGTNAYTYGAYREIQTTLSFVVSAPNIQVTKSVTVAAPANYVAQGGGATDPVPGATLTYTLAYENFGSATGTAASIVDKIPANTEFRSAAGGTGRNYSNNNGATFVYVPAGVVDPAVTDVEWIIGNINAGASGSVTLQVVIK